MSLEATVLQTEKWEDDYDISDGEGDSTTGRISPYTFRLWASGCADRGIGQWPKLEYDGLSFQDQHDNQSVNEAQGDDISSHLSRSAHRQQIHSGTEKHKSILDWQRRLRHHYETSPDARYQQHRAKLLPLRATGDVVTLTQVK